MVNPNENSLSVSDTSARPNRWWPFGGSFWSNPFFSEHDDLVPTLYEPSIQPMRPRFWGFDDFFDRRFGHPFSLVPNDWFREPLERTRSRDAPCIPRLDFTDQQNNYQVKAELPGLSKNDVKVAVSDGMVVVSGETNRENAKSDDNYSFKERCQTRFSRSFPMPPNVDQSQIQATFQNGLLQVDMPKKKNEALPSTATNIPIQ